MEISIVGQRGLKIKAKNTSFIVNPEKKFDEDIVVLTEPPADYAEFADKIVFAGPGEYEVGGVSVKAEAQSEGISFDFFEDGQKLIILSSPKSAQNRDTEDASAVVAYMDGSEAENILKITGNVVAVVGSAESLPSDHSNIKTTDKLNLKKTEEYKGFLVHLSK